MCRHLNINVNRDILKSVQLKVNFKEEHTLVNRLKNDLGKPFLPPPCPRGFWAAKTLNVGGHRKDRPSSGM